MGLQYSVPPLVEALCEIRFEAGESWNPTFPGLIYGELQDDFPLSRPAAGMEVVFSSGPSGVAPSVHQTEKSIFLSADEKTIIQLSPNLLAVNRLRPYPGWAAFRPSVIQAVDAYVSRAKPSAAVRIGLRYINHLTLPGSRVELPDYLTFYPRASEEYAGAFDSFIVGIRLPLEGGHDTLKLQLTSMDHNDSETSLFSLDIDCSTQKSRAVELTRVPEWLDKAHDCIESAFENCLTDGIRDLFGKDGVG